MTLGFHGVPHDKGLALKPNFAKLGHPSAPSVILFDQHGQILSLDATLKLTNAGGEAFASDYPFYECTFHRSGPFFVDQLYWGCHTCNQPGKGVCASCKEKCHAGHEFTEPEFGRFYCDCGMANFTDSAGARVQCSC